MNSNRYNNLLTHLVWSICLYCLTGHQAFAQSETDSLKQLKLDSLNKIKLEIIQFEAVDAFRIKQKDSSSGFLIHDSELTGIQLNAIHPARYWDASNTYGNRLWDHALHGLRFNQQAIEQFKFTSPNKAISEIELQRGRSFTNSQASFQDNYELQLIFASRFKNQVIWNFSYNRQKNKGIYAFGTQENTLFNTGVFYKNKKENFASSLIFSDERHSSLDNWGIENDSSLLDPNYRVRESVPVKINSASTLQFERALLLNLEYRFNNSAKLISPKISYHGLYSLFAFNYKDTGNPLDSTIYKNFYTDSFRINNYLHSKLVNQKINLEIINLSYIQSSVEYQLDINNLDHDSLNQSKVVSSTALINNFKFKILEPISTRLSAIYFDNKTGLNASIASSIRVNSWLVGQVHAFFKKTPIPYSYRYLNLNKSYFWQPTYSSPFISESGIQFKLTTSAALNAGIDLKLSNYSNFVYFDTTAHPQAINSLSNTSLRIHLNYNTRKWNIANQFQLALYQPDPAHLNGWHSEHNLSYNQYIFKKIVQSEFGLQFKLYQFDYKFNFNPILQSFYSSNLKNEFIYSTGLFMHFNISEFRLSLYADHLDSFWNEARPNLVINYPFYDFYFRFGITWKFIN